MKYHLSKTPARKLPSIHEEKFKFGREMHDIIKIYYTKIPTNITPGEVKFEIIRLSRKKFGDLTDDLTTHINGFVRFEKERLTWSRNNKPISIEKEYRKGLYHGYPDIILNKNGKKIVADWKTGYEFIKSLTDSMKIQGKIYKDITESDEMVFVFIRTGWTIPLTEDDEKKAEILINKVIKGIEKREFNRINNKKKCNECEYQISCYMKQHNINWWEVLC